MRLFVFVAFLPLYFAEWVPEMENAGLYEGDMILTPAQQKRVKEGTFAYATTKDNHWPKTIAYTIDSSLLGETKAMIAIKAAIQDYHKYTCLRFIPRTTERAYFRFYKGSGCHSPVGFFNRVNSISLSSGCWFKGTVMHEMAHSLGVYHEQSRPDRDQYVKIHWENIPDQLEYNFAKKKADQIDSLGTTYDYRSMMHYGQHAFGGSKVTIETLDKDYQNIIGSRGGFSQTDILQMNLMYQCADVTATLPPTHITDCFDQYAPCPTMAANGKCYDPKYKTFMESKCQYSCGICGRGRTTPPRITDFSGRPVTAGPWGSCKDEGGNAKCSMFKSMCDSWKSYMHKFCRKTCKLCVN